MRVNIAAQLASIGLTPRLGHSVEKPGNRSADYCSECSGSKEGGQIRG